MTPCISEEWGKNYLQILGSSLWTFTETSIPKMFIEVYSNILLDVDCKFMEY